MERGALLYVDITVAELAAKYLPYAESYYTKQGVATSQTAIIKLATNVLLAKFSHLEARKFGPLGLRACQDQLVAQGLSRSEVNRRIRLIRKMFKWGVAMEMIEPSVLHGLQALDGLRRGRTTAPDKKPVRAVHISQIEAILPHPAPAVAAMVRLQELTGMRPNEVVQMRGCDLNMSGVIWEYTPEHHKLEHMDVERVIPIGPKAQGILKPWLEAELGAYLFSPRQTPWLKLRPKLARLGKAP